MLDLWLVLDETDAVELTEPLLERPLNNRLVFDSLRVSAYGGSSGVLLELNVGGRMSSWVFVSDRMNVNTGGSSAGAVSRSSTLSFFFNRSLKGILAQKIELNATLRKDSLTGYVVVRFFEYAAIVEVEISNERVL